MTIRDALQQAFALLTAIDHRDKPEPGENWRLNAQVLLSHVLGVERSSLYAYPECALTEMQQRDFFALVQRRAQGEPLAYLTGQKEFYGRDFIVDRRVLIPRPETEMLVEAALHVCRSLLEGGKMPVLADIGTGSGIIPVTLALEEPRLSFLYASDISADALEVASLNCRRYLVETRLHLLQGDLLSPLPQPVDVLTANLPYVGTDEAPGLSPDVLDYEPHQALFSGPDGLDLLRRLFTEASQRVKLNTGAIALLEIGYQQREPLTRLLRETWPEAHISFRRDYAGWDRILQITV